MEYIWDSNVARGEGAKDKQRCTPRHADGTREGGKGQAQTGERDGERDRLRA